MATFVLVAGAMHGSWAWRECAGILRAQGHEVHTPTLTGVGDRGHLLDPSVSWDTHVEDLRRVLFYEDLHDVHLVLHSYAGTLAGPVAQVAAGRLACVTYLGAFVVDDGERQIDVLPPSSQERYQRIADEVGDGWRLVASEGFLEQWAVPEHLRPWILERLTDYPLRCSMDPVHFDPTHLAALQLNYIHHTAPPLANVEQGFKRALERGYRVIDLALSHDMMLEDPAKTAEVLLGLLD